jgi:hypothetical protein
MFFEEKGVRTLLTLLTTTQHLACASPALLDALQQAVACISVLVSSQQGMCAVTAGRESVYRLCSLLEVDDLAIVQSTLELLTAVCGHDVRTLVAGQIGRCPFNLETVTQRRV